MGDNGAVLAIDDEENDDNNVTPAMTTTIRTDHDVTVDNDNVGALEQDIILSFFFGWEPSLYPCAVVLCSRCDSQSLSLVH